MKKLSFAALTAAVVFGFSTQAAAQEHGQTEGHGHQDTHVVQTHGSAEMHGSSQMHGSSEHASHQTTGGEHAEHEEHHALDPINWWDKDGKDSEGRPQIPMFVLIINAGILFWLIYSKGKQPISQALKDRRKSIGSAIVHARKLLKEAKARAKTYQGQLEHVVDDTKVAKESLMQAGMTDRERIIREAEEKSARMDRDALFLIDQEKKQLHADLVKETVERSILQAEELLLKRMTQSDQERLAEDFLSQILARRAASMSMSPIRGGTIPPGPSMPAPSMIPGVKIQGDAE